MTGRLPSTVYKCKECFERRRRPYYFTEAGRQTSTNGRNHADEYLFRRVSLNATIETDYGFSRSTLYNRIREQVKSAPSGIELTKKLITEMRLGTVLSLDTTHMKLSIRRGEATDYSYFHFVDLSTGMPIDYGIEPREDAETVIGRLAAIRFGLNYEAKVVVTDLDPAHLEAIPTIFPYAAIQGCLFHLELLLNKKLPTRAQERRESKRRPKKPQTLLLDFVAENFALKLTKAERKLRLYQQVKNKIMETAKAPNRQRRRELVVQLVKLQQENKERRVKAAIKDFLENLEFYQTRDELGKLGLTENMCYSNQCENGIGRIRLLFKRHKQFRSLEAARGYVNYFWWKKRTAPASLSPWSFGQEMLNSDSTNATPSYGLDSWQGSTFA